MMVVFVRCAVGAVLLLPWTIAHGQLRPTLRHWRPLLAFTVLEMTGPWLLLSFAEQSLTSSLTGLLVATVPFAAVIAARVAGDDDRLTPIRLAGMVLGVIGIAALLGLDVRGAQLTAIGAVALVVLGYATAPLIASRALSDIPGVAASSVALLVTAVVYAPFAVPRLDEATMASNGALLSLAVLGILCTAVALAFVLRAHPRSRSPAGTGHHVREPGGRRAAGRCAAGRAVHPRAGGRTAAGARRLCAGHRPQRRPARRWTAHGRDTEAVRRSP